MVTDTTGEKAVDRRTYLAAIASASAASIAGCGEGSNQSDTGGTDGGTDSGGSDEQGERVPEIIYEFTTGLGNWSQVEQSVADIASSNIQERLGVPVTARAKEATTMWQEHMHDSRNAHLYASGFAPNPNGLDPNFFMSLYHLRYAGNRDGYNKSQYANCEFADLAEEQYFATSEEERRDLVTQTMERFSDDIVEITTFPLVGYNAINTDHVVPDEELIGESGPGGFNYTWMTNLEAAGDTTPSLHVATAALNSTVHPLLTTIVYHGYWANLVYSPLLQWDQNYNLTPELAESYEVNDDFKEIVFNLRDATFSNGDPVTAEDVVFTYDLYNTSYDGFGASNNLPENAEVTAVDESTVRFSFGRSNPIFLGSGVPTNYGILPKDHWEDLLGGEGNFSNLPNVDLPVDEIVGSGPYTVSNFEPNTILQLEPREEYYNTPSQGLNLRAYTGTQAAYRDFQEGNLSIFPNANGSMIREIDQKDNRWTQTSNAYTIGSIAPQMSFPPFQFREVRLAASQAINRREASAVAVNGDAEPQLYSNYVAPSHPWWPENHEDVLTKIAPSPTGSEDAARQTLEDAGYSWDSDGRLRYPADKDLTPQWPQGDSPMDYPEEWPCVETIPESY